MGLIGTDNKQQPLPEAGELAAVEALDRSGLLVTSEGTLVRILETAPKNPLVMAAGERVAVAEAFGHLVGRLRGGQSLQFYVEARPVQLDALVAQGKAETAAVAAELDASGEPERAAALRRLGEAHERSLRVHADDQAAVDVRYYVVVPYTPEERSVRVDWRSLLPGKRRLATSSLERSLESHRRVVRESLRHTDAIRSDLEALDLSTRLLQGPDVAELLWRRFNPTSGDRSPLADASSLELLGELELVSDARAAAQAAAELRDLVAASAVDLTDQRYLRVERDLEQVLYVGSTPDATHFGWLLPALQAQRPFSLSVHVHALDRLRERARHRARHRRLFGVNRGAEQRGRVPDYEMRAQEDETEQLLLELSGQERAAVYEVAIYQSLRERGPEPDPLQLAEAADAASREITAASDAKVHRGEFLQAELWQSSLPLGRDIARRTRKYVTRHVGDSLPLVGTSCGSPSGIPFAFAEPGRTVERINPFDPAHDNATLLVSAKSGGGKTHAVNVLLSRLLARGAHGFVLDRAGHYQFLTRLVPGAEHIALGGDEGDHAINPWDLADVVAGPPIEKVQFLVGLHALLVGEHDAGDDSYGLSPLERGRLEGAIRAVYRRAAAEDLLPRESLLREELLQRAGDRSAGGAEIAATDRSLAERLSAFCGDGSYAYLVDRETTVPEDAPLVVFDTRKVRPDVAAAAMFLIAEHVTSKLEARVPAGPGGQRFAGRSFLVIDEAWHFVARRATGQWVNDLARRARHLGLFLVAITQQLEDFAGEYGKALLRNSTMQLLLRQKADDLQAVRSALGLSDEEVRAVSKLKTVKGAYSQAFFINGTRGRGTVSLRVAEHEYWLATSDPNEDVPRRSAALEDAGGDAWAALDRLASEPMRREAA
jgi:hypothetical protein